MPIFIIKKEAKWHWFYPCHFFTNGCIDFGSNKLCFHCRNLYGSLFWICDQNRVDDARIFQLLLSSAERELRNILFLLPLLWGGGLGCTRNWERMRPEQLILTD